MGPHAGPRIDYDQIRAEFEPNARNAAFGPDSAFVGPAGQLAGRRGVE
jgi:hypothetical protein